MSIAGNCVFLNYAVWESVKAFRVAFAQPEFQEALSKYPKSRRRLAAAVPEGRRARDLHWLILVRIDVLR